MDIYAEHIIDLYKNPLNMREIRDATSSASGANLSCGDRVRIYVKVSGGIIRDLSFQAEGCAISIAAASLLTEELKGTSVQSASSFDSDSLRTLIGIELGHLRLKCALLPLETLQSALSRKPV